MDELDPLRTDDYNYSGGVSDAARSQPGIEGDGLKSF